MAKHYQFGSPIYFLRRRQFFRRRKRFIGAVLVVLVVAGLIVYDLWRLNRNQAQPVSKPQITQIGAEKVYKSDYFQFSDPTDNWVFDSADSSAHKFVYARYHGKEPQHLLTVYVNQQPIPLNLAVSRVLPVTVSNGNQLHSQAVSEPCGKSYKVGELLSIHNLQINGTTMLCQPDAGAYTVVMAKIGGDYNLDLTRQNGSSARYVVVYQNLMFTPSPAAIVHIGNTFKAL